MAERLRNPATSRKKDCKQFPESGLAGRLLSKEAQDIVLRRIQLILDDRGLDHEDLALGIGRSRAAVSMYFSRKRKIDLPTLDVIAKFLGVETYQLLIDDPAPPRPTRPITPQERAEDAARTLLKAAGLRVRIIKESDA